MPNRSKQRPVRTRKKQTRLEFSALPSSSPAKAIYNPAIQDRLAAVRYTGGLFARHSSGTVQNAADGMLTPEPSSQPWQDRDISPLNDLSLPSSKPRQVTSHSPMSDDDDDELILPSSKRRRLQPNAQPTEHHSTPTRRSTRLQDTSPRLSKSSPPNRLLISQLSDIGSAEISEDEDRVMASKPTQRRRSAAAAANDAYVDEEHEISDQPVVTQKPRRRKHTEPEHFVVNDNEIEYITSDEDPVESASPSKSEKLASSQKRPRTPQKKRRREQQELAEDLEDLQDSDQDVDLQSSRTRGGPVTTQRDKAREHFNLLRRRRAGEKIPRVLDSDDDADNNNDKSEDMGRDLSLIGQPSYDLSDEYSARSSGDTDVELTDADLDEDNFIEDDTSGRRGRPHPDIPIEFTSYASAKPRELFVHIIEWLVKNKVAPAFNREDALFNLAFDRVDDQVKAQAGSRLISSAWNATFKYIILARPTISITALPGFDEDNIRTCDACNKTNRPAKYDFRLSGDAYFNRTLEPVDHSDDDDEDEPISRDEAGHPLASQETHFYLGSHCAANAQMGHKLTHWKHHLNNSVLSYLEEQGVLSAESIVAREKMNKKQREKEAEAIVDSMQETGKIADFWKDFQTDLDDARLGMEDYTRRGGRSQGRIGVIQSSGLDGTIREWRDDKYKETRVVESDSDAD